MKESQNYWSGIVTGIIVGAASALFLSLKREAELRHSLTETTPAASESADVIDIPSAPPNGAVKAHDVIDSV